MKVLVVFGSRIAMKVWSAAAYVVKDAVRTSGSTHGMEQIAADDGCIVGCVVTCQWDAERLRGLRYDVVLEDDSFAQRIKWRADMAQWPDFVRAMILSR